jgi:hypothetical protein
MFKVQNLKLWSSNKLLGFGVWGVPISGGPIESLEVIGKQAVLGIEMAAKRRGRGTARQGS